MTSPKDPPRSPTASAEHRKALREVAPHFSEVFVKRMQFVRQDVREWSLDRLAERLEELGETGFYKSMLSRIERGQRTISLDDALAICAALNVSPTAMLTPSEADAFVAVTPKLRPAAGKIRRWFAGEQPLDMADDLAMYSPQLEEQLAAATLYERQLVSGIMHDIYDAAVDDDNSAVIELVKVLQKVLPTILQAPTQDEETK